jgi:exodeoxyribonuclease-3
LVKRYDPQVLCLQETKVENAAFPREFFSRLGFVDAVIHGQKTHYGVAIVSKLPLSDAGIKNWCGRSHCRHVFATLPGGIELHNFYVPAGGDDPDPLRNPKFAYKLKFMAAMDRWFRRRRRPENRYVLVGDLNVAPHENDVWDHRKLKRVVTHTQAEVDALGKMLRSHDWIDAVRHFVPESKKLYSWWSYRASDWKEADKGRRLDHIWVTPALGHSLEGARVIKAARGWEPASDHAPVMLTLRESV